ncbi:uncharacterized protein I303_102439 [Kwoniella dejecticola CBS 10117]|uniref:Uncharacterized protein n=1 Tax=Kwoniella dejecticola CBS 10117 TaxID=1296121 RepID=A0A1A6A8S0_9TREE|nr:uncharacterized protein I303_02454 [Kwoniella dejecticola CBS 10117]OBR86447.1 hypothetical protein I303_02454 [Kwoniella dejecticola CBS 10117]
MTEHSLQDSRRADYVTRSLNSLDSTADISGIQTNDSVSYPATNEQSSSPMSSNRKSSMRNEASEDSHSTPDGSKSDVLASSSQSASNDHQPTPSELDEEEVLSLIHLRYRIFNPDGSQREDASVQDAILFCCMLSQFSQPDHGDPDEDFSDNDEMSVIYEESSDDDNGSMEGVIMLSSGGSL